MSAIDSQSKFGPLLTRALDNLDVALEEGTLPLVVKLPTVDPRPGEGWKSYQRRVKRTLSPTRNKCLGLGIKPKLLLAGNAMQCDADPDQLRYIAEYPEVAKIELDPLVQVVMMDNSIVDIDLKPFATRHQPHGTGTGVTVAVLDSGVDPKHPFLNVSRSIETCGESVEIPGSHGTHCAGSIASRDKSFPGVAPDVTLINVKVLMANGSGRHTSITQGIDAALDAGAQVLSMSIGFNHLPTWSQGGHGWLCTNGRCPLCTAVDNATIAGNAVCIVAAGNEHERAENLRRTGKSSSFDTELGCPGQAREAITVAAVTKRTFLVAPFSSHGPTSFGTDKPDLCGPGVNITSTIPVPRRANGKPVANPSRTQMFGRKSGTSMATPMVAGAAALVIQQFQRAGVAWTPAMVRNELVTKGIKGLPLKKHQVGVGRLHLKQI